MPTRLVSAAVFVLFASTLAAAPVEILPRGFRGAVQPQIAVAPSGRIHVVFGQDNSIFHASSPDGRTFTAPVKIGTLDKLALRMRRGPRVTATDALVLVTAISHTDGNLHAWTSADAGKNWRENAPLNTAPKSAREGLHALVGNGRGLVAAVWLDLRGAGTGLRGRISRDGGASWAEDLSIYESPDGHICECCVPNAALSPSDEIGVMWRNWVGGSRDLYLATSRDGLTFSPAQKLGTGTWKLDGCPMDGGGLTFTSAEQWLAVWRRERGVFASDATAPETLLAPDATQAVVASAGRTPIFLWEAGGSLQLQRGRSTPVRLAEAASAAAVTSNGDSALVVWESGAGGESRPLFDRIR